MGKLIFSKFLLCNFVIYLIIIILIKKAFLFNFLAIVHSLPPWKDDKLWDKIWTNKNDKFCASLVFPRNIFLNLDKMSFEKVQCEYHNDTDH